MRPHAAELLRREVQAAELRRGGVEVEPAAHGVLDRLGLLEDLLEHVVRDSRPWSTSPASRSSTWTLWIDVPLVAVNHPQRVGREHGQFVVGQIDDLVGVAGQRRGVAGDEMLAVAHADAPAGCPAGRRSARRANRGRGSPGRRCPGVAPRPACTAATSGW